MRENLREKTPYMKYDGTTRVPENGKLIKKDIYTCLGDIQEDMGDIRKAGEIMVYSEKKEQNWREQAAALQKRLDYYEQENARLQLQNEALHETAWQLIRRIRTLEGKK